MAVFHLAKNIEQNAKEAIDRSGGDIREPVKVSRTMYVVNIERGEKLHIHNVIEHGGKKYAIGPLR